MIMGREPHPEMAIMLELYQRQIADLLATESSSDRDARIAEVRSQEDAIWSTLEREAKEEAEALIDADRKKPI